MFRFGALGVVVVILIGLLCLIYRLCREEPRLKKLPRTRAFTQNAELGHLHDRLRTLCEDGRLFRARDASGVELSVFYDASTRAYVVQFTKGVICNQYLTRTETYSLAVNSSKIEHTHSTSTQSPSSMIVRSFIDNPTMYRQVPMEIVEKIRASLLWPGVTVGSPE